MTDACRVYDLVWPHFTVFFLFQRMFLYSHPGRASMVDAEIFAKELNLVSGAQPTDNTDCPFAIAAAIDSIAEEVGEELDNDPESNSTRTNRLSFCSCSYSPTVDYYASGIWVIITRLQRLFYLTQIWGELSQSQLDGWWILFWIIKTRQKGNSIRRRCQECHNSSPAFRTNYHVSCRPARYLLHQIQINKNAGIP